MPIKIDGYLTEKKLAIAIEQLVNNQCVDTQVKLPNSKFRWDVAFEQNGSLVLVEFDGDAHYCNSLKIKRDEEKDSLASEHNNKVIRIPYWVQLNDETAKYYFGISANIQQDFPHGFITTTIFPASFCELGIKRFERELEGLPSVVKEAVIHSLKERIDEHGIDYVLPSKLKKLVDR